MKASDNPHVGYDDDDDSGTVTFLGVSHNSSLGSEWGEGKGGQDTEHINGNGFHFDT